ncbi:MAG: oxidoreductase [Clostridiaceae bacterium]|nr:oxidoreductase [Clostridiaceae bacterium]
MLLDKNTYFIKEQVQFMKLSGKYDIFDPITNSQIGLAKEEPGGFIHFMRFLISKAMLPNTVNIYDTESNSIAFTIKKPFTFIRSKVSVYDGKGEYKGYFKGKILTIGGGFWVFDSNENEVAEIKGDWKGWNFNFLQQGKTIGTVTKKWAGLGKELFTSADNYVIALNEEEFSNDKIMLLLAAGLAIDIVYKEKK